MHEVFLKLERQALRSGLRDTDSMDESEKQTVIENVRDDLASFTGGKAYAPFDWEAELLKVLAESGIQMD